jgi:hypothetical protein
LLRKRFALCELFYLRIQLPMHIRRYLHHTHRYQPAGSLSLSLSLQMPAASRLLFSSVFFFFLLFRLSPPSDFHYTTGVLTTLVSTTKATET